MLAICLRPVCSSLLPCFGSSSPSPKGSAATSPSCSLGGPKSSPLGQRRNTMSAYGTYRTFALTDQMSANDPKRTFPPRKASYLPGGQSRETVDRPEIHTKQV